MTVIEALLGKKDGPVGGLAALFGPRKRKRHALPKWAAQTKPPKPDQGS
ncbi:hypothetical protein [Phenylobacterium sp.]|nr:hypothetical protein [Phenylobacterium sp.]